MMHTKTEQLDRDLRKLLAGTEQPPMELNSRLKGHCRLLEDQRLLKRRRRLSLLAAGINALLFLLIMTISLLLFGQDSLLTAVIWGISLNAIVTGGVLAVLVACHKRTMKQERSCQI